MVQQIEIVLKPKRRGFHLVTSEILSQLPKLPKTGIVNIFNSGIGWYRSTIQGRCRHFAQYDGGVVGDGFVADLCRLYCDSQPVEHPYVDIETHVLCAADMHDVSAGLFIYFARLASDVAAISPSMVLCVLVGFGANGSLASIHDHSRS